MHALAPRLICLFSVPFCRCWSRSLRFVHCSSNSVVHVFPLVFVTSSFSIDHPLPSASPPPLALLAARLACHSRPSLRSLPHCMIQFHLSLSFSLSLHNHHCLARTHAYIFYFAPTRTVHFRLHVAFVVVESFPRSATTPPPRPFVVVRFPRRSFCVFTIRK